jgi:hypothetical protein
MPSVHQTIADLRERIEQLEAFNVTMYRKYREMKQNYRQIMQKLPDHAAWARGSRLRIPRRPYLLRRLGLGHDPIPDEE